MRNGIKSALFTFLFSFIILCQSMNYSNPQQKAAIMDKKEDVYLRISVDKDLWFSAEIFNSRKSSIYFLYDMYENIGNPIELHLFDKKGKKVKLPEIITAKYTLQGRTPPYAFTEVKPGKSAVLFKQQFVKAGSADWTPQYKRMKINTKNSYEILWRDFYISTGIKPGKYSAYVTWKNRVAGWCDERTGKFIRKEGAFTGKLKSNRITFTLPEFD